MTGAAPRTSTIVTSGRTPSTTCAYQSANDSLLELNDSREVARMEVARTYQERMLADSLSNVQDRYARELAHQEQLGDERDRRNLFLFSSVGVLVVAGGLYGRLRYMRRSRAAISRPPTPMG